MAATQGKTVKAENGSKMVKETTAEDFEAQIATLREELAKVRAQLASSGEKSVAAARKAAASGVDHIKAQGENALVDLRSNARDIEAEVIRSVREKPVTSLAIAAGVGFVFALLARR